MFIQEPIFMYIWVYSGRLPKYEQNHQTIKHIQNIYLNMPTKPNINIIGNIYTNLY